MSSTGTIIARAPGTNIVRINPVTSVANRVQLMFGTTRDQEFLPAALEILQTPPSPLRLTGTWLLCAMLTAALAWSFVAHLDIYASASGRVQPSGRSKVIQPFETGRVKAIHVGNGTAVKAGQPLIDLDTTDAGAEHLAAAQLSESLDAEIARRHAEIEAVRDGAKTVPVADFPDTVGPVLRQREQSVLEAELGQFIAQRDALLAQRQEKAASVDRFSAASDTRKQLIAVLQERYDTRNALQGKGAVSRATVLDAKQLLESEMTNLADTQGQTAEAQAAVQSFDRRVDQATRQFAADQQQQLTTAERKRDQTAEELSKATGKLDRTRLVAPIDGTVQQLAVTTVGQVVSTGQPVMVVVPSGDKIQIEALVPDSDVGFIKVGDEAVVKVNAFPFTRYGTLTGRIVSVSRDSVDSREAQNGGATATPTQQNGSALNAVQAMQNLVYPVTVELAKTSLAVDGKDVPLVPGMTTTVEVRTGDRSVISYLFQPILETTASAGHER